MKYFFVGGFFPKKQIEMIQNSSSGVVQNAANVFQTHLLKGFDIVFENGVLVLNLPFIGSYPRRFNKIYFPPFNDKISENTTVRGIGFLNLTYIKYFSRFLSLFSFLMNVKKHNPDYIFIYSMNLPFIMAVIFSNKLRFNKSKVCLIIPDLPEYMNDQGGFLYNIFKKIETFILNWTLSSIDKFIVLTKEMALKLKINQEDFLVIEGIADDYLEINDSNLVNKNIIFYSGTLAKRYGVCDLIDAFNGLDERNIELWICGDGDAKGYINKMQMLDNRIKYLGQLPRDEVIRLQRQAKVLVNPRMPEGEYTKYSFPSKIMEYMCSGRPVIMYRLQGIPLEYYEYCYTPLASNVISLRDCLAKTIALPDEELTATGLAARNFVLNNKSYLKQAEKIKKFITEEI